MTGEGGLYLAIMLVKNERAQGIRIATHAEIQATAFEYIEGFYNRKHRHSTLGDR